MTAFNNPRLITPPKEAEEIFPYRRVWRSIIIESSILLVVTGVLFVIGDFLGIQIPENIKGGLNLGLALLPTILWLVFSYLAERRSNEPRQRLFTVALISGLVASGIALPFINNVLRVDEWLPLESASVRIVGYALTVGITIEFLKYLVIRYSVYPEHFRIRIDGLAYGIASAIGFITILNLSSVTLDSAEPHVTAMRVFSNTTLQFATSAIVSVGISQTLFSRPTIILQPLMLLLAAFITGIAIPVRSGLVSASLSPLAPIGSTNQLFGFAFSTLLYLIIMVFVGLVFNSTERRPQEVLLNQEF